MCSQDAVVRQTAYAYVDLENTMNFRNENIRVVFNIYLNLTSYGRIIVKSKLPRFYGAGHIYTHKYIIKQVTESISQTRNVGQCPT